MYIQHYSKHDGLSLRGVHGSVYHIQMGLTFSDCADYSYGESWRLEEIVSPAAMSRLTCASQCMQTMECRGFSLDGAVCRLLRVVAAVGGLTGCDSRANIVGTTFLSSSTHNELSMIYNEWTGTELPSHASYGVSVFRQHHDVSVYIWRRLNPALWQGGGSLNERLSWSPLFKWM
ncbi:hypothetical protein LSAT2_028154 [Lamellibrachia satsuma]|nr:hypothetical protein LSAT2_028154 [Lamellibrachia satsuma]